MKLNKRTGTILELIFSPRYPSIGTKTENVSTKTTINAMRTRVFLTITERFWKYTALSDSTTSCKLTFLAPFSRILKPNTSPSLPKALCCSPMRLIGLPTPQRLIILPRVLRRNLWYSGCRISHKISHPITFPPSTLHGPKILFSHFTIKYDVQDA